MYEVVVHDTLSDTPDHIDVVNLTELMDLLAATDVVPGLEVHVTPLGDR